MSPNSPEWIGGVSESVRNRTGESGLQLLFNRIKNAFGRGQPLTAEEMKTVYDDWLKNWKPSNKSPGAFKEWGRSLGTTPTTRYSKPWKPLSEKDWQDFLDWYDTQRYVQE